MSPGHTASSTDSSLAGAPSLDPRVCSALGARLCAIRDELKWTPADVANRLLLSTAQVHGLERADAGAFHNPAFFAIALRKYATLLGLDCPDALLTETSATEADSGGSHRATRRTAPHESAGAAMIDPTTSPSPSATMKWISAAAIVVVTGAGLALLFGGRTPRAVEGTSASAPALPADLNEPRREIPATAPVERPEASLPEPLATSATPTAPVVPTDRPALSPPSPTGDVPAGVVTLTHPAWVFVRYGDNSVIQRTLRAGQSLTLTSAPIYLAIGAGEGVTVMLHDRPVDVSRFRTGDEIRIAASDLAALAR